MNDETGVAVKPLPVLVVEDDTDLREALKDTLELSGYETLEAADGEGALRLLENRHVGIIVTDVQMKPMDGETLLREVKARWPATPVLLMTAYGMIERAVEAMRQGACNYLPKPFEPEVLVSEVARWMLPVTQAGDSEVIAEDRASRELLELARRVAASEATVLVVGESGVGKEVVAQFIHRNSARSHGPFVAINCAAIPDNLLEATLFGYERGAFTGASQSHAGKFEQAQAGSLLLDEITEMPLPLQAKLLRVLQEREVERVGGKRPIALDVRVLATSNRDLEAEVQAGRFREDLYYRLNVFPLRVPALRERRRDILPLARAVLARAARGRSGRAFSLSAEAESRLTAYTWKGNIRELENVMQRAMILAPGASIEVEHLCLPGGDAASDMARTGAPAGIAAPAAPKPLPADLKSLERAHILDTLASVGGVRKAAAERLKMSERTLRYKLAQYRLEGAVGKEGEA
ncbi:MAG: sigma-54-dependent Fis family transcriptional regulator [Burkholderiales bacterium]|nr:sigma-54-dependent Fis family transcriptional regulator [Burkholderiales bacterium]